MKKSKLLDNIKNRGQIYLHTESTPKNEQNIWSTNLQSTKTVVPERWKQIRKVLQLSKLTALPGFPGYGISRGTQGAKWIEEMELKVQDVFESIYMKCPKLANK